MATGRVLQFDHGRGYGFVAADDGGEDVFLHASVFDDEPDQLAPGVRIEFKIMAGDRGRKAFAARIIDDDESDSMPESAGSAHSSHSSASVTSPSGSRTMHDSSSIDADDDQMCDVLSAAELSQELTELLLSSVPELSGQHIVQVRRSVLELAKKHGWCDG